MVRPTTTSLDVVLSLAVVPILALIGLFHEQAGVVLLGVVGALVLGWAALRIGGMAVLPQTPLVWPILAIVITASIGTWRSPYPALSIPKLGGLLVGVLLFRLCALYGHRRLPLLVWSYYAAGVAALIVGVLGLPGLIVKMRGVVDVLHLWGLPETWAPVIHLPGTESDSGVNPNALGVLTLFFLPGLAAFTLAGHARRLWAAIGLALHAGVLVLTQSRAALASGIVVGGAIVWWYASRPVRRVVVAAALVGLVSVVILIGRPAVTSTGTVLDTGAMRFEIWSRAVDAIRAHPIAGVGLNAFRLVIHQYAPMKLTAPGADIAHAHNVFLETALDLGLPGLAAYLVLLVMAGAASVPLLRSDSAFLSALGGGALGTLVATHLFGLVDSVSLGSKVGIALWITMGMIVAGRRVQAERRHGL